MDPHQREMIRAARALGLAVVDRSSRWGMDAIRVSDGRRDRWIFDGRVMPDLTVQTDRLAANKHAFKRWAAERGLPVAPGIVIDDPEEEEESRDAVAVFLRRYGTSVCKPREGTHGEGVLLGISEPGTALRHVREHRAEHGPFLLERQIEGADLRIQAVGGAPVAACVREPASVVGDGETTLRALIDARNDELARLNPHNRIRVDRDTRELLDAQSLPLDEIPDRGRRVVLKRVANIAQGGRAIDVTAELHPDYAAWCVTISETLGIRCFALDVRALEPAAPADRAILLELNTRAEWLHHTFSERRTHDVARLILLDLFREAG